MLQMVYREVRGLHQAAYILALFAFGSQLLALVRDRMLAHQFGAGIELDLYYTAFRIPDILFVLFASTLSVYVLIPFVAERIDGDDSGRARALLSHIFTLFLVSYAVLAVIVAVLAPYIVPVLFPGFVAESETLVLLIRILLLQPFLLGISSLFGVITQMGHRFVLYALSPLIYNFGIIFGIVVLYPALGLSGLAIGVVLGALGHILIQTPFVFKDALAPQISFKIPFAEIQAVLLNSLPRALTLSLNQIVLLVLIGIASVMTVGSVSVFQFAYNLQSVPLAIIGVSYSVAAFPILAKLYSEGDVERFQSHIITALRHIIFWSVPTIALFVVVRAQLVRVVLGTGAFDWNDTMLTAAVLVLFMISLTAQAINLLLIRVFYAGSDTKTPFLISIVSAATALFASYSFYHVFLSSAWLQSSFASLMRVENVPGTEVLMLALGYSVALLIQSGLLLWFAQRRFALDLTWLPQHMTRALFAAIMGGITAYLALNLIVEGIKGDTLMGIFIQGMLAGLVGLVAVVLSYYVVRTPELREVCASFHRRIFKTNVVAAQDDVL